MFLLFKINGFLTFKTIEQFRGNTFHLLKQTFEVDSEINKKLQETIFPKISSGTFSTHQILEFKNNEKSGETKLPLNSSKVFEIGKLTKCSFLNAISILV